MGKKVIRGGYEVDAQRVRVRLTDGFELIGLVNLAENNCSRVSELFTKDASEYLVMFKCDNGQRVMIINKKHVMWAIPLDEQMR